MKGERRNRGCFKDHKREKEKERFERREIERPIDKDREEQKERDGARLKKD